MIPPATTPEICTPSCDPSHTAPSPTTARPIAALNRQVEENPPVFDTPLETQRLNAHFLLSNLSIYERRRHEAAQDDRCKIAFALERLQTSPKALSKFCACGSNATVWRHRNLKHEVRVRCHKCGHRLCPACAAEAGWVIQKSLTELGERAGHNLSLITLTLKHGKAPLATFLTRLVTGFRELRRTMVWRTAVKGGAWIIEVKRGRDGDWHPHIHVLADANYIRPGELQAAWLASTGDSSVVDIRRRTPFAGARYVAKYLVKPVPPSILATTADLEEFILATKRVRRCATFGTWRGTKLTELYVEELWAEAHDPGNPENWEMICHYADMIDLKNKGNREARELYAALTRNQKGHPP